MVCLKEYFWSVEIIIPDRDVSTFQHFFNELNSEKNYSPYEAYICILHSWLHYKFYTNDWEDVVGKLWCKNGETLDIEDGIWLGLNIHTITNKLECSISQAKIMYKCLKAVVNGEIKRLQANDHPFLTCEARYYIQRLKSKLIEYETMLV